MLPVTLKIIHFLALAVGLGGGVANQVLAAKAGGRPEVARPVQRTISRVAFAALVLLWVTGLWMAWGRPVASLGPWFWVKMAAVLGLTGAAVTAQLAVLRPGPGTRALLKKLGIWMTVASTLAVVFAVLAFG